MILLLVFMQLTRDLFSIAKFLFYIILIVISSVLLLKVDLKIDARHRCIRVLNVGWINTTQNNVQSLYFTIPRRF